MAQHASDDPTPREEDARAALEAIRQQLLEKIRERYDISPEEAERRLRALEQEG